LRPGSYEPAKSYSDQGAEDGAADHVQRVMDTHVDPRECDGGSEDEQSRGKPRKREREDCGCGEARRGMA